MSDAIVIAILGAESSGKTTLAVRLAQRLRDDTGLTVARVPEVLRTWCHERGRTPRVDEQASIAQAQEAAIDTAAATHDIVVADTTSMMVAIYSQRLFADDALVAPAVAFHRRRIALSLVLALDLPWVADGFLRDGPHVQRPVLSMLRELLVTQGLPWAMVAGVGDARLDRALDAVAPLVRARPQPGRGLFTRLDARNAEAAARPWRCETCDDPDCEHALRHREG